MERLIDNALIYGKLMRVSQPHQIARYNIALEAFGVPRTSLTDFTIDRTGFSREIAHEIEDWHYLDPHRVNRRFILLSPDQADLPVIASNFSSTSDLMQAFFRENEDSLRILTLKDVVYGEIEDSTHRVDSVADILSIRKVKFHLRTSNKLLESAREQQQLIQRFYDEPDSWRDDALLKRLLELAHRCGDTRSNGILPERLSFKIRSFWTTHFGGIYVFQDNLRDAVIIGTNKRPDFDTNGKGYRYIPLSSRSEVHDFLMETDRLEPLNETWLRRNDVVDTRLGGYVRRAIAEKVAETDLRGLDDIWIQNWVYMHLDELKDDPDFDALVAIRKELMNAPRGGLRRLPPAESLLVSRANPKHRDRQLVNRLLSDLVPYDFLSRFILNKDAFYLEYASYPETLRDYVVDLIKSTYVPNKPAVRERLFDDWRLEDA